MKKININEDLLKIIISTVLFLLSFLVKDYHILYVIILNYFN